MPTYEYACKQCGEHIEVVQAFTDEPLSTCPSCSGPLRKVFGAVGISFKGSGFYRNDSRSAKTSPASSSPKADGPASSANTSNGASGNGSSSKGSSSDGASGGATPASPAPSAPADGSKASSKGAD